MKGNASIYYRDIHNQDLDLRALLTRRHQA